MAQINADTTCATLLRELQRIWDEVGETDSERDRMLLQLEQECLEVYRRKVDQANCARARLHQSLADYEAEVASLSSTLGDRPFIMEKRSGTLREQQMSIQPQIEVLRLRKEERRKQFQEVKSSIQKTRAEISGEAQDENGVSVGVDEDLSLRRLDEFHAQLQTLQKEKNSRMHKVMECVNSVHELCSALGINFFEIIRDVHPSLDDSTSQSTSISNQTLDKLSNTISSLDEEKQRRLTRLQNLGSNLIELWQLMDTPFEDRQPFRKITQNLHGALALDYIEQAEVEVRRLTTLKASKMKELVLKKQAELDEICRHAHMECDVSLSQDKVTKLLDLGVVDPSELLCAIEEQIVEAKEESLSRKEIMERMEKWMAACEEESWLEDYNRDESRYTATRGAHLNLKRAERARMIVAKLPAMLESVRGKVKAWENERGRLFLYNGMSLVAMLEQYNLLRQEKDEVRRRQRDEKKMQEQMQIEQETLYGSKPSPTKNRKGVQIVMRGNGSGATSAAAARRLSLGPDVLIHHHQHHHHHHYQHPHPHAHAHPQRVKRSSINSNSSNNGNGNNGNKGRNGGATTTTTTAMSYICSKDEITSVASSSEPTSPSAGSH